MASLHMLKTSYFYPFFQDTHLDGPLTDNASRLSKMLLQNVKHLKPIEQAFQNLLSQVLARKGSDTNPILTYLGPFCKSFKEYVDYACGLEALTIACLQHESNLHSCPPTQQAKNSQLQTSLRSYNRVMVRLGGYMETLAEGEFTFVFYLHFFSEPGLMFFS